MKQVLQHVRSGRLELADVPEPAPRAGGVVVRDAASLISAGTEKMVIGFAGKSLVPFASRVATTRAAFVMEASLRPGRPGPVDAGPRPLEG